MSDFPLDEALDGQPEGREPGAEWESPAAEAPPFEPPCLPLEEVPSSGESDVSDQVEGEVRPDADPDPIDLPAEDAPVRRYRFVVSEARTDLSAPQVTFRRGRPKGRRLVSREATPAPAFSPEQRLLILDTWRRSGLPAGDYAPLVGVSAATLYGWKARFEALGPVGLVPQAKGRREGSRLPELTKRTILMLKEMHPEFGCQRISDLLLRGPALPASPGAVARVLKEHGYEMEERLTVTHPEPVRRFERARPNQLWQTDLFTFILKRQNRRVWLVAFLDDHSRFVVGYGLHASASGPLVLEVLRAAMASYGRPEEVLTDRGSQYVTWRGVSQFAKELARSGIKHLISQPRHPKTLGKIERFWGTMWREFLATSVFLDLGDAQRRIGLFLDYYNFLRPHQGLEGAVPADRFFGAAPEVLRTLKKKVAPESLKLAREGIRPKPFYLTGRAGEQSFSIHTRGEQVILSREGEVPTEIDLSRPVGGEGEVELPLAICPEGRIEGTEGKEEPRGPGGSSLEDEGDGLEFVDPDEDGEVDGAPA